MSYGVLASLGFGGASGVAASVAVTYWFTSRRGLAFALVEAGFGPACARAAVPRRGVGWRGALLGGAVLLVAGVAPVLWRRLRDRPEDVGLLPIGGPLPAAVAAHAESGTGEPPEEVAGLRGLARSRGVWFLAAPSAAAPLAGVGRVDVGYRCQLGPPRPEESRARRGHSLATNRRRKHDHGATH